MTPVLARLRQAARWAIALAVLVGAAAWAWISRRRASLPAAPASEDVRRYERDSAAASARHAVETAAARAVQADERERLIEILRDEDEDRRNDRLIEEARRIRGE